MFLHYIEAVCLVLLKLVFVFFFPHYGMTDVLTVKFNSEKKRKKSLLQNIHFKKWELMKIVNLINSSDIFVAVGLVGNIKPFTIWLEKYVRLQWMSAFLSRHSENKRKQKKKIPWNIIAEIIHALMKSFFFFSMP